MWTRWTGGQYIFTGLSYVFVRVTILFIDKGVEHTTIIHPQAFKCSRIHQEDHILRSIDQIEGA